MSRRRTRSDQAAGAEPARVGGAPGAAARGAPGQRSRETPGAASPVVVFSILGILVVLLAAAAIFLASDRTDGTSAAIPNSTQTASSADQALTDEEAIERFTDLDSIRLNLFLNPSSAAVGRVFIEGSPAAKRVIRSLEQLERRQASLRHPVYRTVRLEVKRNAQDRVELEQEVVLRTKIIGAGGRDLTADLRPKRQTILWVMERTEDGWLIYDGSVVKAEFIKDGAP